MKQQTISLVNLPKVNHYFALKHALLSHIKLGRPKIETLRKHFVENLGAVDNIEFDRLLTELRPVQGWGDRIAYVTQLTGVDKAAEKVARWWSGGKKGCGCGARREKLNSWFPSITKVNVEKVNK